MNKVTINLHRGLLSLARQFVTQRFRGGVDLWDKGLGHAAEQLLLVSPIPAGEIPPQELVQKLFTKPARRRRLK